MNKVDVQKLKQNADKRIANNKTYQLLLESAQWKEKLDKNESITLNQAKFEKLMKEKKTTNKKDSRLWINSVMD